MKLKVNVGDGVREVEIATETLNAIANIYQEILLGKVILNYRIGKTQEAKLLVLSRAIFGLGLAEAKAALDYAIEVNKKISDSREDLKRELSQG